MREDNLSFDNNYFIQGLIRFETQITLERTKNKFEDNFLLRKGETQTSTNTTRTNTK